MLLILLITVGVQLTYRYSYFVGFRDSMPFKPNGQSGKPLEAWLPDFDLARPLRKITSGKKTTKVIWRGGNYNRALQRIPS